MASCTSCGSPVPDGQRSCSMCYGDPYHGSDGYYLEWMRSQDERAEEQRQAEAEHEQERG